LKDGIFTWLCLLKFFIKIFFIKANDNRNRHANQVD
jgi:hypothetical protein